MKKLSILGIRGIPAQHGGFETFAEFLSLYLINKGWEVTVYCQECMKGELWIDAWKGIKLVHIPVSQKGPIGTIIFDLKSITHSLHNDCVFLTLGYNTSIFSVLQRLNGKHNVINMDGIEWKRQKWGPVGKVWFWINERFGCWFGNHLIADHPCIAEHLTTRVSQEKITMIPYGGREILDADKKVLKKYGLEKNKYAIIVARAEPENSILELVRAFSEKQRHVKLVVLGKYEPDSNSYHRAVMSAASNEVVFLGPIYESERIIALRFFSRFYVHGHQVGGTNPSLVEAMGAGNAVMAHDNKFNRWVAGNGAIYFTDVRSAKTVFNKIIVDDDLVESLKTASKLKFRLLFQWGDVLRQYERLLFKWLPREIG